LSPALAAALRWLRAADRFSVEIRSRLEGQGFSGDEVDSVMAILSQKRLVNDERTAENWLERAQRRGKGWDAMRTELIQKGLPEDQVENWLEKFATPEPENVRAALQREFPLARPTDRAKAFRRMVQRGVDPEVAEAQVEAYFGDREEQDG